MPDERCPCRSRRGYAECCGPYLAGAAAAPTVEALMRSRFTAYARYDAGYVLRTWHSATRPLSLELGDDLVWVSLQIVATTEGGPGDDAGTVHFRAAYRTSLERGVQEEVSRFAREDDEWRYLDGDVRQSRR